MDDWNTEKPFTHMKDFLNNYFNTQYEHNRLKERHKIELSNSKQKLAQLEEQVFPALVEHYKTLNIKEATNLANDIYWYSSGTKLKDAYKEVFGKWPNTSKTVHYNCFKCSRHIEIEVKSKAAESALDKHVPECPYCSRPKIAPLITPIYKPQKNDDKDHWKKIRWKCFERENGKCFDCRAELDRDSWHCHHLTYERYGHEALEDVQALCVPCHQLKHPDKNIMEWEKLRLEEKETPTIFNREEEN